MGELGIDTVVYIFDTFFVCEAVPDAIATQNNEFILFPNCSANMIKTTVLGRGILIRIIT
jgi:hypothetical protein